MTVAVLVTLMVIAGLIIYGLTRAFQWRRTPIELRGDWWGRFERQFQAYVSVKGRPPTANRPRR